MSKLLGVLAPCLVSWIKRLGEYSEGEGLSLGLVLSVCEEIAPRKRKKKIDVRNTEVFVLIVKLSWGYLKFILLIFGHEV